MRIFIFLLALICCLGCNNSRKLHPVSVAEFAEFISATGYVTDAEKFGWSIMQQDVYNFRVDSNLTWQLPNGRDTAPPDFPVTQVSYNDAIAYCEWADVSLPTYEEFWKLAKNDKQKINENSNGIVGVGEANIVGNVWDITTTENGVGEIRLAGGSYFCSPATCNGTNPNRLLFVDKTTGNTHIGFSVINKR